MKGSFPVAVLLLLCINAVHARPDSTSVSAVVVDDAATALAGAVHVFTSPARWECRDWCLAGAVVGVTAGSTVFDTDIRSAMRPTSAPTVRLADAARVYGEGWFVIGVTAGAYGTGVIIKDRWLRETAVLAGTAIIVSTIATRVLKPVVGRGRPYLNVGSGVFHMFSLQDDYNSFPSGHTVAAFSLSSVLAARIDKPLATIVLYGLAGLTALSRVYTDQHWFSDVVFGGIFASAVGRSLVMWHEAQEAVPQSFRILPGPDRISLVYCF
jgi:membrane-associated phospholipid phosphatase